MKEVGGAVRLNERSFFNSLTLTCSLQKDGTQEPSAENYKSDMKQGK